MEVKKCTSCNNNLNARDLVLLLEIKSDVIKCRDCYYDYLLNKIRANKEIIKTHFKKYENTK